MMTRRTALHTAAGAVMMTLVATGHGTTTTSN